MSWETIFDWGVTACARQARAEMELVGAVLADPGRLAPVAAACGVTPDLLEQDDLRVIYAACVIKGAAGQLETLALARAGLQRFGGWDPNARAWERGVWSEANLARLACSWPASEQAVRVCAERVVRIAGHLEEARACWRRVEWLLNEAIGPWECPAGEEFYGRGIGGGGEGDVRGPPGDRRSAEC